MIAHCCPLPTAYCLQPTVYSSDAYSAVLYCLLYCLHYCLMPIYLPRVPTAYCLSTAYCRLPRVLPTAYCLLPTAYMLPTAYCLLTYCLLPTAMPTTLPIVPYCLLPTVLMHAYCLQYCTASCLGASCLLPPATAYSSAFCLPRLMGLHILQYCLPPIRRTPAPRPNNAAMLGRVPPKGLI